MLDAESLKRPILLNEKGTLYFAVTDASQDQVPPADQFRRLEQASVRCVDCALWLRFEIEAGQDLSEDSGRLLVELAPNTISAQLFREGTLGPLAITGRFALADRTIPEPTFLLPIYWRSWNKEIYTVRLSGRLPMATQLVAYSDSLWEKTHLERWVTLALYIGAIATLLLINLFLFFGSDHRKERAFYVFLMLSLHLLFISNFLGYTMVLWPQSPQWDFALRYVSLGLGLWMASLFGTEFMQLSVASPRLHKWVRGAGVAMLFVMCANYISPAFEQRVGLFLIIGFLIFLFTVTSYMVWRRHPPAYLYLLGFGSFMLAGITSALLNNGFLGSNFLMIRAGVVLQSGAMVEAMVMAIAITKKVLDERKLREQAENARAEFILEARTAAEAAGRAKSDFIRNMSHELRTPLNSLVGYSDFLLQSDPGEKERREIISTIKRQSEQLTTIVGDILDFASLEKGTFSTSASPFNLRELFEEVRAFFLPTVTKKGMTIEIQIPPEAPLTFTGDRFRIRQILMNVVGNACKFSNQGKIEVRVAIEPGVPRPVLLIHVIDQGPGIAAEFRRLIFEPFFQVHGEASRQHGGMGLGLSFARDLAKALAGDLTLVHSELGVGSEFEIRLPEAVSIYTSSRKTSGLMLPPVEPPPSGS